jgi:ligand-binding SRPBCC domain-containing protein
MKIHTLQKRQFIKKPLSEVFAFFSEPANLALLTPRNLGFELLTPPPIQMKNGTLIDYTIKLLGINVRWTTFITELERPRRFVDVQLRGPYSFWHHTHEFSETDEGTVMTDTVKYAMPMGLIGRLVHVLFVQRQLESIFNFRRERVEETFSQASTAIAHTKKTHRGSTMK